MTDQLTLPGLQRQPPPTGNDLKQRGIEKVLARERENVRSLAYIVIQQLAAIRSEFNADDIAALWEAAGMTFHHPNVAGGVIRNAVKSGVMVRTGRYVPSRRPSRHSSMVPVYRSGK